MTPATEQLPSEGGPYRQDISFYRDNSKVTPIKGVDTIKDNILNTFAGEIIKAFDQQTLEQNTPGEDICGNIEYQLRQDPDIANVMDAYSMSDVLGPRPLTWDLKNLKITELFQRLGNPEYFNSKPFHNIEKLANKEAVQSLLDLLNPEKKETAKWPFTADDCIQPMPLHPSEDLDFIVKRFYKATGNYRIALFAELLSAIQAYEKNIKTRYARLEKLGRNSKIYKENYGSLIRDYENLKNLKGLVPQSLSEAMGGGINRSGGFYPDPTSKFNSPYDDQITSFALNQIQHRPTKDKEGNTVPAAPVSEDNVRGLDFFPNIGKLYQTITENAKKGKYTNGKSIVGAAQAEPFVRGEMLKCLNRCVTKPLETIYNKITSNGMPFAEKSQVGKSLARAKALLDKLNQGKNLQKQLIAATNERFNLVFGDIMESPGGGYTFSKSVDLYKEISTVFTDLYKIIKNRDNTLLDERLLILWNIDKSMDAKTVAGSDEKTEAVAIAEGSQFNKLFSSGSANARGGRVTLLITQHPITLGSQKGSIKYVSLTDDSHCVDEAAAKIIISHASTDATKIIERATGKKDTPDQELVSLSDFDVSAISNSLVGKPLIFATQIIHSAFVKEVNRVIQTTMARSENAEEQKMFNESERISGIGLTKTIDEIGNSIASEMLAGISNRSDLLSINEPAHGIEAIIRAKRNPETGGRSEFNKYVEDWIKISKDWKRNIEAIRKLSSILRDSKVNDTARLEIEQEIAKLRDECKTLTARIPHLMILYGGGGTGKTMMADGLASMLGFKVVKADLGGGKDMWLGNSEKNLKKLWHSIMSMSNVVVLFDEIDTALGNTADPSNQHETTAANTGYLLKQLDNA